MSKFVRSRTSIYTQNNETSTWDFQSNSRRVWVYLSSKDGSRQKRTHSLIISTHTSLLHSHPLLSPRPIQPLVFLVYAELEVTFSYWAFNHICARIRSYIVCSIKHNDPTLHNLHIKHLVWILDAYFLLSYQSQS